MGTSNFHTANAQATYVIDYDEDYMWQECQELLGEHICELDSTFEFDSNLRSDKELRSFPASSIGYWLTELRYLNNVFGLRVNLFIRSGYYEAANLDYEIEWTLSGCDYYEDIDSIIDEINDDPTTYDISRGIWAMHRSNLADKLATLQDTAINSAESILAQVSTPYGVTAQFSNGETIYTKLRTNHAINSSINYSG